MRFSVLAGFFLLSGHALAQERVWSVDAAGEDAFLIYGVAESDDVGISIWCKIGTDKTSLFFPVTWASLKNEEVLPIEVVLGERGFKLNGRVSAGETLDNSSIEADLPVGNAFFEAIRATDRLKLSVAGHKSVYPLAGAQVDALLSLCHQTAAAQ